MIRLLSRLEEISIVLILGAMTVVTFSQVVARYVFNSGWVPALELTTILFQWLIFFGISYCLKKRSHLGVGAIINFLPNHAKLVASALAVSATFIYIVLIFWGGKSLVEALYLAGIESEDLPIQRWVITIIMPLGALLFGVRLLSNPSIKSCTSNPRF